ncbi:MAG TPA: hypothetical protein ENJ11_07245 [Gammaproteobacteria bacterium]|nr:hypothetical protein [Gammaproteobacteria bacterium]
MFEANVYNDGTLIVGRITGVVEPQSFINGIFWQIDSRNVGEVKDGFAQLYYDTDIEEIKVTEEDVRRIAEINSGIGINIGRFRTALVISHPEILSLAKLHQQLAQELGQEVELFETLDEGFAWLGCVNPEPERISL